MLEMKKSLFEMRFLSRLSALFILVGALALVTAGCKTAQYADLGAKAAADSESMVLNEGDTLVISFPGAPNLNTSQKIRRDGRITLPVVGEFKAAGLTPADMEKQLVKLYEKELVQKEVSVTVESSVFPVFVTGAVLRPGKVISDRPLTALEAIMEAGGFDYARANLKAVTVIRHENGQTLHHKLDLKKVLKGGQSDPFQIKPSDIIYVPERFTWF
jgi:polysaccharide export outer membrane protein